MTDLPRPGLVPLIWTLILLGTARCQGLTAREDGDRESVMDLDHTDSAQHDLVIGKDTLAVVVTLVRMKAELSIALHLTQAFEEDVKPFEDGWPEESPDSIHKQIIASRFSSEPLVPGRYVVEVSYEYLGLPLEHGRSFSEIPYTLRFHTVREDAIREIQLGDRATASLLHEEGDFIAFAVDVPAGTKAMRFDLDEVAADVELVVNRGSLPASVDEAGHQAITMLGRESVVIDPVDPAGGRYYAIVIDQIGAELPIPFTLLTTPGVEPPASLLEIPQWPAHVAARPELNRALSATVEVLAGDGGGSATLVGEHGLLLTNWHVVADPASEVFGEEDVIISVPLSLDLPPRELFHARVERFDRKHDLALLRIVSGLYGQPIREGYVFPGLPLDRSAARTLRIGEELFHVGFPAIGGTESRASISMTPGLVSGFQCYSDDRLIKTQSIFSGNSGGGTYDSRGQLVGIPSQSVGGAKSAGSMGYSIDVSVVPEEWCAIIEGK